MSNKFLGGVRTDSTSVSAAIKLTKTLDGTPMTGVTASQITASYWRQGESPTSFNLVALNAIDSVWLSGGFFEASSVIMPGGYRVDLPDTAFASGADWVEVRFGAAGVFDFNERYSLESAASAGGDPWSTRLPGNYGVGTAGNIVGNNLDTTVSSRSTFAGGAVLTVTNPVTVGVNNDKTNYNLNMSQAVPVLNVAQTLGDALNAARAQGFGQWILSGNNLVLYAPDGTTVVRTFNLDSTVNPTRRI